MPLVRLELTRHEASVSKTDMSANSIHRGIRGSLPELNWGVQSHNLTYYHYTKTTKLNFLYYLYPLANSLPCSENRVLEVLYEFYMRFQTQVPLVGLEPTRLFKHGILSPVCATNFIIEAWLSEHDSNMYCTVQSRMCYHCTIG